VELIYRTYRDAVYRALSAAGIDDSDLAELVFCTLDGPPGPRVIPERRLAMAASDPAPPNTRLRKNAVGVICRQP
jgi:hypothetical protein